jgi:hypothetical protein
MRPDRAAAYGAAFAEGRRLREAAAQRRRVRHEARMEAHRTRMTARHVRRIAMRRAHRMPPAVFVLMVFLVTSVVAGGTALAIAALIAAVIAITAVACSALVVGGAAVALTRRSRRRRAIAAGTAPLPAAPRPEVAWSRARQRFHALRSEYAAFECDPMQVLHRPALADVSVGSTARFVDAFAEAQALETDAFPPGQHAANFAQAVDRAERAWRAAVEAADRIRLSGLSPAERGMVERVIKLLTTARDSDSDPERLAAYARARAELAKLDRAGVVHLPRTAQAALDEAARGALPA